MSDYTDSRVKKLWKIKKHVDFVAALVKHKEIINNWRNLRVQYLMWFYYSLYLKHIGVWIFLVFHNDCLVAGKCIRDRVLSGIKNGL